jgi:hypothetical protein
MRGVVNLILVTQRISRSSTYLSDAIEVSTNVRPVALSVHVGNEAFEGERLHWRQSGLGGDVATQLLGSSSSHAAYHSIPGRRDLAGKWQYPAHG